MDRLSLLLPGILHKRGLHSQAKASLVVHQATEWLHGALPLFITDLDVLKFADGTVTIAAKNSIAAQECQQVLPLLQEYLVKDCQQTGIESLQITRQR